MTKAALNREYFLTFFIGWVFFYLVFPSWLLPVSVTEKALVFITLWLFFLVNGQLFRKWNLPYVKERLFQIDVKRIFFSIRENKILLIVILLFSAVQFYPLFLPIKTRGDEGYHAQNGIEILKMMNIMFRRILPVEFHWIFKILVAGGIAAFFLMKRAKRRFSEIIKKNRYMIVAFLVIFFLFYFIFVSQSPYNSRLHRFPPLSKIIHAFTYLLFFPTEFFVRLPQLIFTVLAAVFLFRTVSLFKEKEEGFFAALTYLCLPLVIYYASDGELEAGILFFLIIASFFFLRHLKFETHRDFLLTILCLGLGFLYKRPLLIMIPLIWIFLFLKGHIKFNSDFGKKVSYYLKCTWFGLVPIIPWLVITKFLPLRSYTFRIKNWFDPDLALKYLYGLPKTTGVLLILILCLALVYCLVKRSDWLSYFFIVQFLLIYILISSDLFLYHQKFMVIRFASYFSPSIAVFVSALIYAGLKKIKNNSLRVFAALFLFVLLFLNSSLIPPQYTGIDSGIVTFYNMKSRYVPYDQALSYISLNFPPHTKILATMGPNPIGFYSYKYNALNQRYKLRSGENFDLTIWRKPKKQNIRNLYEYCIANDIDYFMYPSEKWVGDYINQLLITCLRDKDKSGDKFEMMSKFEFGGNTVYISKVLKSMDCYKREALVLRNIFKREVQLTSTRSAIMERIESHMVFSENIKKTWSLTGLT